MAPEKTTRDRWRIVAGSLILLILLSIAWRLKEVRLARRELNMPGRVLFRTGTETDQMGTSELYRSFWFEPRWPFIDSARFAILKRHPHDQFEILPDGTGRYFSDLDGTIESVAPVYRSDGSPATPAGTGTP
jgi:hypothetical protein